MMQPSFKFKITIFLVTVSLLCSAQTEPQGSRIVNQDVAQESEEQFLDDPQGRREDQWWNNYEAIEEQAKTYDDQLEMIYMYKFNPLDYTTTTKLKTPRPTTSETFENAVTSPTSTFNRETQVNRNRQKPQHPKIETPKPIFKEPEDITIHFDSEAPIQTSPQPQLPSTQTVPLRKHKPASRVSAQPEIQVSQAPPATPIAANPQPAFTQRSPVVFQAPSQTFRPNSPPIQLQSQTFRPQNQNFQPQTPNAPLQAQNNQPNFQSRPQNPRPQPHSFQPQQQNFQPNIPLQQQNIKQQSQNFPSQPQNIQHHSQNIQLQPQNIQLQPPNIQNQPPKFQPQNSQPRPQNFQQRPQFQNDQAPTTLQSVPTSEETVQPIVSTPSAPAAPRLPLQFVPGKTSPFNQPRLPFDFRSIPNAIPLPAYLFQKPAKPIAPTSQKPPNRGSSPFATTTVNPETITNTEFSNFPGDATTRNSRLKLRARRPTTLSPEKPDLEDKTLFDVVVPKKAGGKLLNQNRNNVNLLTNIENEGSVALSAAPSSNEPQRVSPTQTTAPRRGGRRGSPHGLPTTPTASPNSVNHPFLEPTTPTAAENDNLPRYVRLLNRYSLLESNQSAPDRKRIQNRQVNLTQVEQHPPSARLFNGDVTTTRNQRRRRPTSSSSTQIPVAHADSISSDSVEAPSFQRSNSRTQRRFSSNTELTSIFTTTSTNSPTTSRTDRSRRRFSTEVPNLSTTTTPGIAVTTAASTPATISRRPLKRGRGFAFHQTSSTTSKQEAVETTENPERAESNDNLEQNGLVTDELKNKQENNSNINPEENSEQVVPTSENGDEVLANGLRKRKLSFKRKPSSSLRLNSPVINKPNLIGNRGTGHASNKSLVIDSQAQSSISNAAKFKPKSAPRSSVDGSSGLKLKSKPNSQTTVSPVVSTTKRRTFRFQPKFKKQSDVTEEPSATVEPSLNSNDTTESEPEIEEAPTTTTTESIVKNRPKPGRSSLFARPSINSSKRPAARSPTQSGVTTVSPLKTSSQIITTTKKSFKSRFRTTTTTTEKPITETQTIQKELDVKSVADEALIHADSTPKLNVEPTTVSPIVSRQKSRFSFLARVTPSPPPTALPTETPPLSTSSPVLLTAAVTESVDLSVKTTKRLGKRRRRPSTSPTQSDLNASIDVTTFTPAHTFLTSTFNPDAEAKILLHENHEFIRHEAGVETSTFPHVANISVGETKIDASGLNGDKRRKIRRRKITQRSTSALNDLLASSSVNFNTFSTTETGFNSAQTTPNQQIITSTINSLIAIQQEAKSFNDSEKTKALAKKELLEKIASKKSVQSFQQNGFTFNSDEPLVMAADDSGVWFSNPDESSVSENRSPPLSFRSRSKRIEDPEVKTDVEKIISGRRSSPSGGEDDSWFSGGDAATEQVSIDRKDDNIEPEEDSTTPKESSSNDGANKNSENKNENKPKITQKSKTATFSVSSSTSVQSEISKRRSSSSIPGFMLKKQDEPKVVSTSTKFPLQDDDDGFRIADLGPPRVIVIDKVTMRFRESDIEATEKPLRVEDEEDELITTTTEDELDKTTSKTEAPAVRSNEKSESEDKKEKSRTNPNENMSPNRRNRLINMSRGGPSSPKTTTTTTTSTEASTTESDLHQDKTTEAPAEVEAAYKNPSDEVGYFGPEEVVPEAKGALDDLVDESHFGSVGVFDDPGASLSSDDVFNDEVAAVNVSEHNDDEGHGHQSEPAPGDEASIWELSPSFNVEVLSRAPRLIQLASKRETSRSDTDFLKPMYDLLTKQRSRLPLFDDPVNQIKIPNDYEFSTSKNDFYKRFQAFQYDKSLDDLLTTSSLVEDHEPLYEDKSENLTDVQLPVTAKPSAKSMNEEINLHRPTNCSRSDRNVCPLNDDYPRLLVERVIKQSEKSLRDLWEKLEADRNPSQIYPEDNEEDSSKHDLSVCDSTVETFRPGWARNAKNDKWMVIINSPAFPQFIRVELCLRLKKECLFISPYYRSSCTEHHSAHRLVAIDPMNPSAGPVISIFKFPCGCSCKVEMFHGRN